METELEKLVDLQRQYIRLLSDELNELVVFAIGHNWKTARYHEGARLRAEIASAEKEIYRDTADFPDESVDICEGREV